MSSNFVTYFLQILENIIHNVAIIDNACVTLFFVPLNVYMIIILFLGFIIIASSIEIIHWLVFKVRLALTL